VLIMEAIVIGLAIPVAIKLEHVPRREAVTAGAVLAVAAVLLTGGSVLQVLVVAAGVIVPAMYVLGVIFAGLWTIGIWLGHRVEQVQAGFARAAQAQEAGQAQAGQVQAGQVQGNQAEAGQVQAGRAPGVPPPASGLPHR
jgi:hypothetical protein